MRKFFSILISTVFLTLLVSGFLVAQETLEQETLEEEKVEQEANQVIEVEQENALATQGPITEADIKVILKVMPEINNLKNEDLAINRALGAKILEKNNMSKTRYVYLSSKIPRTLMAALKEPGWEEALKNVPPFMIPNEAEMKIVKKYNKQLTKLFSVN